MHHVICNNTRYGIDPIPGEYRASIPDTDNDNISVAEFNQVDKSE